MVWALRKSLGTLPPCTLERGMGRGGRRGERMESYVDEEDGGGGGEWNRVLDRVQCNVFYNVD